MVKPIKVQGRLERDDYVAAYLLAERRRRLILRLALTVIGVIVFFLDFILGMGFLTVRFCQIMGAVVLLYGLLGSDLLLILRLRRQFGKDPKLAQQKLDMTFSDQGITAQSEIKLAWDRLAGWRADGLNFLIYFGDKKWFPVPRRLVPQDRVSELRDLLAARLGPPS